MRLCEHRYEVKQNLSDFILFIYLFIRTYVDWCQKQGSLEKFVKFIYTAVYRLNSRKLSKLSKSSLVFASGYISTPFSISFSGLGGKVVGKGGGDVFLRVKNFVLSFSFCSSIAF